jgi:isoleucyl-tRNA synthetase
VTVKSRVDSEDWLSLGYHPRELELKIRDFWKKNRTAEKLEKTRRKNHKGIQGYVEGPPTLNGYPHVGHLRGRVMKDLHYRWKTMQGYYIPFWTGWDCQGLPVELEVERSLGVRNKKDLLKRVGEERFIKECKATIRKYYEAWHSADVTAGVFINDAKAYWTYLDDYIEREWKYLKSAWDQGLLGEGHYVVAYCPHCQTSLSNAEVGMSYEEVEDPSLYFKIRVEGSHEEYFLVWTTMPFTLVTDLMLAVHPEADYVKVKVGDEVWIMVEQRVKDTMQELKIEGYTVVETLKGHQLAGVKYEYPFLDLIPRQRELDKSPNVHCVVTEDFVDTTTATGIVHLAPGNGEEDFFVAQRREVPIFVPFDDEVIFTKDAGAFAGLFARDADSMVLEELEKRKLLASAEQVRHEYPTCWRSGHKLVWLARREYYLWTNKILTRIVEAAQKIEYYFDPPRNRFLAFLQEGKPWCFSRERIWGTPLPIWVCTKTECRQKILISSKKELFAKAKEIPKGHFELHKPWVDQVVLECPECSGRMLREPFVLDTWHNSGAAPYARFTDDEFDKYIPADFLVEAIDQTRGWANTLLLEHVILTAKPESPYKAFLFYGHVLDAKGRKMSKSVGNVIDANETLEKCSADLFRFYILRKCTPIDSMSFDVQELNKRPYQILSTLLHLYRFLVQNATYDRFNPKKHTLTSAKEEGTLTQPDHWVLSKLQTTVEQVTEKFQQCEFNLALSELEEFVVNTLSHHYVPIVRPELWSDDATSRNRRLTIYATLWTTLKTLNLLFNPITPFLSEAIHLHMNEVFEAKQPQSINFESWPIPNPTLKNPQLEREFEVLLKYVSLTYSARQTLKLKRRWPLARAVLAGPEKVKDALRRLESIFLERANVKTVEYLTDSEILKLETGKLITEEKLSVFLDSQRDAELVGEGFMRDLARRVQALRKQLGFSPTEILESVHLAELNSNTIKLLNPHLEKMVELVRTRKVDLQSNKADLNVDWREFEVDGKTVSVAISR